jgi:hypothetical protein
VHKIAPQICLFSPVIVLYTREKSDNQQISVPEQVTRVSAAGLSAVPEPKQAREQLRCPISGA